MPIIYAVLRVLARLTGDALELSWVLVSFLLQLAAGNTLAYIALRSATRSLVPSDARRRRPGSPSHRPGPGRPPKKAAPRAPTNMPASMLSGSVHGKGRRKRKLFTRVVTALITWYFLWKRTQATDDAPWPPTLEQVLDGFVWYATSPTRWLSDLMENMQTWSPRRTQAAHGLLALMTLARAMAERLILSVLQKTRGRLVLRLQPLHRIPYGHSILRRFVKRSAEKWTGQC